MKIALNWSAIFHRGRWYHTKMDILASFCNQTIELALAHTIKNQAEAAYRRGDQLERRRELMKAWNQYIDI